MPLAQYAFHGPVRNVIMLYMRNSLARRPLPPQEGRSGARSPNSWPRVPRGRYKYQLCGFELRFPFKPTIMLDASVSMNGGLD